MLESPNSASPRHFLGGETPPQWAQDARWRYQELAQLLVPRRKAVKGFSYGSDERYTALAKIIRGRTHFQACDRSSPPSPWLPGRKHSFFYFFVLPWFSIIITEISLQGKMII